MQSLQDKIRKAETYLIMSRLPLKDGEMKDAVEGGELDYLIAYHKIYGGIHPDAKINSLVNYTRTRMPFLDQESFHLWCSLHSLQCISEDYAVHCSIETSVELIKRVFNWSDLPPLPEQDEGVWYAVAFRSKRKLESMQVDLYEADRRAHEESVRSGGLLLYWYGTPNPITGNNLAKCIWTNRQDAIRASSLPLHMHAASLSQKVYEKVQLSRYAIRKVKGESGLRLEQWANQI